MADRQDIDALIVGALYGELDAADRARLETHLATHPEDRTALEALERTRATVRRGIADLPSAEPNPAISTILLREAGRLAPSPARAASAAEAGDGEGLWTRFLRWARPVAMHPAFAGAAALLLVGGTATALWVQGKGGVTEPEAPRVEAAAERPAPSADPTAPPAMVADDEGDFRVDLAQEDGKPGATVGDLGGAGDKTVFERARDGRETVAMGTAGKPVPTGSAKKKGQRPEAAGYLEVTPSKDPVAIKDFTDSVTAKAERKADAPGAAQDDDVASSRGAKVSGQGQAARAPEPKPTDPALEEWAQGAHGRLAKLVGDGKCPEAGRLGAEIKDRAPEYYAAKVANDRAIRACKSYIEGQAKKKAEKDYKSRSQSNTYDESSDSMK